MDWPLAIERNRSALLRIVAGLIAMVGLLTVERVPRTVHRAVLFVLRPAESAVRRLIVIAAHGLEVKTAPARPMPAGLKITGNGKRIRAPRFQLFDTRKRFAYFRPGYCKPGPVPRVIVIDSNDGPLIPAFLRAPKPAAAPIPDHTVPAKNLCRRLTAIKEAIADIPKQAQRLVRWQARRARMTAAKFRDPLRPGAPPGRRKRIQHEVDELLAECHRLAHYRTEPNTS